MKKIALLLLLTATVSFANAQSAAKSKTGWGIKLGLNTSNIRIEDEGNSKWKTGLVTGVFVNIKAGNKFSLQPEFLYSSMGGKEVFGAESSLRLNYFSLPVLAQYRVTNKLTVFAGPQVDVMILAKTKASSGFDKVTNEFKETSFNATGGLSVWPLSCFGLTARYIYGFNNIAVDDAAGLKNQGVQLTAALKLK